MVGDSERTIRRCNVISVAKYARCKNPIDDNFPPFPLPDSDGEVAGLLWLFSIFKHAGNAANHSFNFN